MKYLYKYMLVLLVISLISACKNESPATNSELIEAEPNTVSISQNQFTSSKFELGRIEERSFSKVLSVTGALHIPERSKATVSTLMRGTVGVINLVEGQWVRKGQKLFSVTNPELINLQEEYLVATGQLEYLREEYDRQIDLSNENLSTKKDLLKAKSELTTTQARYGSLRKKLSLYGINADNLSTSNLVSSLTVTAPISGYVSDINVRQGMYIDPNESALTLTNTSQLYLELSVLEKDAFLLKKDQKLTFTLQSDRDKEYQAVVYLISKSINDKQMILVNCEIEGDTKQLVSGMYANANIILDGYKANALPETALVKIDRAYYALAFKKKDGESLYFEKVTMETGEIQNGYIELVNPPSMTSEYLTKGAYFLVE